MSQAVIISITKYNGKLFFQINDDPIKPYPENCNKDCRSCSFAIALARALGTTVAKAMASYPDCSKN